jgi:xylitol oxidase
VNSNWAANLDYAARQTLTPRSVEEVQAIVRTSNRIKALGTRHSFNSIADTDGDHVWLRDMDAILELDKEDATVSIQPGVRYGELSRYLAEHGFGLPNLASLPHISVAGACATATHGSGDRNGCLATSVVELELVDGEGRVQTFNEGDPEFGGVVVHLGAIGIVTRLKLRVIPSFMIRQSLFHDLPLETVFSQFDEITSSAYSVSLFTSWRADSIDQVWLKQSSGEPLKTEFFGARAAETALHPVPGMPVEYCTEQLGVEGPWHERLPHFRLEFTPSSGEELQSEYLVPRSHAVDALKVVNEMRDRISPWLHISEIRTVAADDFWMSPFCKCPCVGIHFTWKKDWDSVRLVLPEIEEALVPFRAKPHWGKLFTMPRQEVFGLYERVDDFRRLAKRLDPELKFGNEFLSSIV